MANPNQREYVVRVPKNDDTKHFSLLKFNDTRNVEPGSWPVAEVTMSREENQREVMAGVTDQDYGEGSVYGRAAREEARRKKFGRSRRKYQHDAQPWRLSINGQKYRSIQEGGAGEFADYWVFLKVGDDFQAHKISDWHQFLPCITHKTLDSEQAEEKFQLRDKVMNQFALKAQIMRELKEQDANGSKSTESVRHFLKIKDEGSSDDDADGNLAGDESDNGSSRRPKTKKGKPNDKKKDKRQRVDNADDVAAYESEDGQDEGREYDYMSDSGSDTDPEEKTVDEKMSEALVGVGDESGLKAMIGSDLDTTSDEENEEKETEEKPAFSKKRKSSADGAATSTAVDKNDMNVEERDSSGSDSDDPDKVNINSVFFMQRKDMRKRPTADEQSTSASAGGGGQSSVDDSIPSKRAKVDEPCKMPSAPLSALSAADALDEETVRRLLLRKPHTTKELLDKVKPRCGTMSKADIVAKLAVILKKIEPYQFRQKVEKKEVLYFSLNQSS